MRIIKDFEDITNGGPLIIEPTIYKDDRGYFFESFNNEEFKKVTGLDINFVQDNESCSSYGTLRGLHFQNPPYAQSKLVRVVKGAAYDIVVDIRKGSPTYGSYFTAYLSEYNHRQFFVPKGFAHSFIALRDNTIFQYKCDEYYNKQSEGAIHWNSVMIPWEELLPFGDIKLSDKDKQNINFMDFNSPFEYE